MDNVVGAEWLKRQYGMTLSQPLSKISAIGQSRKRYSADGVAVEIYPPQYKPENTLAGHLTFFFKREPLSLEFLSRLFRAIEPVDLLAWLTSEPTGQYSRKACFFFEWMTGKELPHEGVQRGAYVEAINPSDYLCATTPEKNNRWRVRDNLPGDRHFCPVVRRTARVQAVESYDVSSAIRTLGAEFGSDVLLRSAAWLTVKESRSSFAIEHEHNETDRVNRFAAVIERFTGIVDSPLSAPTLEVIQSEILGPRALSYGVRKSPVMVSESRGYTNLIHYLAPHWHDVYPMLRGLEAFESKTRGQSAIIRAAILSFGVVYIHPFSDGNGRVSRFLINDTLRRDGVLPKPYILPVSAVMQNSTFSPANYDEMLETFSKPLMRSIQDQITLGSREVGDDGVEFNISFSGYRDTESAWRYIDMTKHAEYLGQVIERTIDSEMRMEANILIAHERAMRAVKEILEGPDQAIERIIRSVRQSKGRVSNKLRKEYPLLSSPEIASEIVDAVRLHLPWEEDRALDQDLDLT